MSIEEKKHVTFSFLYMALSIVSVVWAFVFSYVWINVNSVEAKQEAQDTNNTDIKAQLSQIQTDISWIKDTMNKQK